MFFLAQNFWDTVTGIGLSTLSNGLSYAVLALGIFLSYRILNVADLGAEGCFTLGGAVTAVMVYQGVNPFIAIVIASICGFLAGAFTGVLHTKLKIPALLSGIITMTGLFTINMIIMGIASSASSGQEFNLFTSNTNYLTTPLNNRYYFGLYDLMHNKLSIEGFIPLYGAIILSVLIIAIAVIFIYYFFGTEIGMSIRATGINGVMARAQGINTDRMTILGLGISNALIALGGGLTSQVTGSTSTTMGVGVLVIGLASIIIGEAIFGTKTFKVNIFAVMFGALIYYLIIAIVINTGLLEPHFLKLLYAILILIILVSSNAKKNKKGGIKHA